MHDDIYYEYALAMTTKTWPLKLELDKMILDIVQSGIQKYWENQVINQLTVSMGMDNTNVYIMQFTFG